MKVGIVNNMIEPEKKKVQRHCSECGKSVWLFPGQIGVYDIVCEECKQYEQKYAEEINKQQEEFLRKEEPYLYD